MDSDDDVNGNSNSSDCCSNGQPNKSNGTIAAGSSSATKISKELEKLILDQRQNKILGAAGRVVGRRPKKQAIMYQHEVKLPEKKYPPKYDNNGIHIQSGKNFCDCLTIECPGCHEPCPSCQSKKCSIECRCNRTWCFNQVITQSPFGPSRITATKPS